MASVWTTLTLPPSTLAESSTEVFFHFPLRSAAAKEKEARDEEVREEDDTENGDEPLSKKEQKRREVEEKRRKALADSLSDKCKLQREGQGWQTTRRTILSVWATSARPSSPL